MNANRERPTISTPADVIGGPATEVKQDDQITQETALNTALGAKADAAASSDDGTFSLIALFKRLLEKLTAGIATYLVPQTSGGLSPYRNIDLDENGVNPKAAAGQVFGWYIYNNAAATRYVKFYNKATAPTNGDTPVKTFGIPAGAAANVLMETGMAYSAGIGLRATTGVADNDTGAPSANDVVCNIFYK